MLWACSVAHICREKHNAVDVTYFILRDISEIRFDMWFGDSGAHKTIVGRVNRR